MGAEIEAEDGRMTDHDNPDDELMPHQAARFLGVHLSTLNRYARRGQIRFRTLPSGQRRYRKSELDPDQPPTDPQEPTL